MGEPGAFINGLMSLSFGAPIVAFHGTQWTGWAAIVTFVGWGQVTKGIINLCFPARSLLRMAMVEDDASSWKFAVAGAAMIPIALAMLYASTR